MARVYLGLGANLGDRRATLRAALDRLRAYGEIVAVSSLYETAPVGYLDQPPFLNAVVALDTEMRPEALLSAALAIERGHGRQRSVPNAPRTLDIDLLLIDDRIIDSPSLTIPHPRLHERAFVLVPLAEIAPTLAHPVLGNGMAGLRDLLGDVSGLVRRVAGPEWFSDRSE